MGIADLLDLQPYTQPGYADYIAPLVQASQGIASVPIRPNSEWSNGEIFGLNAAQSFGSGITGMLGQHLASRAQADVNAQRLAQAEGLMEEQAAAEKSAAMEEFKLKNQAELEKAAYGELLKDPKARPAALKKLGLGDILGETPVAADTLIDDIGALPKGLQKTAATEAEAKGQFRNVEAEVRKTFDDAKKLSPLWANMPLTTQAAELEAMKSKLLIAARGVYKDQMNQQEGSRIMALAPSGADLVNKERLDKKMDQFLSTLKAKAAATPILDAMNAGEVLNVEVPQEMRGPAKSPPPGLSFAEFQAWKRANGSK